MLKFIWSFLLMLVIISVDAQEKKNNSRDTCFESILAFERSFAINNIDLGVKIPIKKSKIILALRYHLNDRINDNRGFAYWRRVYAANQKEAFGLAFGIQRNFKVKSKEIRPYWFYLSQLNYMTRRVETGYLDTNEIFVITGQYLASPRLYWEHEFGVGLQFRLFKNVFFEQACAVGYLDIEPFKFYFRQFPIDLEPSCYFRIGLTYKFSK